jgi:hypothetical protein
MPAAHTSPPVSDRSDRAFNRMYVYCGAGMIGVLFILLQYRLSDQSATAMVATLAGLAAVGGYCSLAIFKAFREAILPARH